MASYLGTAKERFEVAIFKATSQLDLASLRDHKICSNEKGVFPCNASKSLFLCKCLPQFWEGYNLQLSQNFCKVVSLFTSLIWMKDRDNVWKEQKTAMDSKFYSSMLEEGSYWCHSKRLCSYLDQICQWTYRVQKYDQVRTFQETDLALYPGVHSCRRVSIWSSGRCIVLFWAIFQNLLKDFINRTNTFIWTYSIKQAKNDVVPLPLPPKPIPR